MSDSHMTGEIAAAVIQALKSERMTLKDALTIIERGEEMARSLEVSMVFTVVDDGGNMVAMHRMDDSLLASISVSHSKAYTAAALRLPTEEAAKSILPGQPLYGLQQTHPGKFCIFGGGVPLTYKGRFLGGLGVSGGTVEQDIAVARHAAGGRV
ncbi:GlcG/HbpS family heme-binding protein [Lacrimispora sp. JR3]|uniref:GlcG/HbpS family heme-binding protein n=1 Tax=Lacrimispora sinapis TaxID=3111456 RepID=UPI00374900AC